MAERLIRAHLEILRIWGSGRRKMNPEAATIIADDLESELERLRRIEWAAERVDNEFRPPLPEKREGLEDALIDLRMALTTGNEAD